MSKSEEKYKYIRAWGRMLHSFDWYINDEIDKAQKENAPNDAVYARTDHQEGKRTGEWVRFSDLNPETQERVRKYL
ncbi:hypothetical protein [Rhizobium phage RHEph16]|uniref:Uncharacterized protein n=1 Tax=Rhizobium phage RHEph16 TaxID=2836132 RepID=A0AAE7VM51_9CAUD|nr:hypothetical protein PP750_gp18 [Rhizobium phage RHEph16]QXV74327.1 hypothetical protein [Rhizobium phage RHEph16]